MKIYIADKEKIVDYSIPDKVEDSFLIDYVAITGVIEKLTLVAEDDNWTISSNYDVKLLKDNIEVNKEVLVNDSVLQIKFSDLEDAVMLYVFDVPMKYYDFDLGNKNTISLGRTNTDIQFNNSYINDLQFKIVKQNNFWVFTDNNTDGIVTYINGKVTHQKILNLGDVIFSSGLKLIWMEIFIRINNPTGKVKTILPQYKNFNILGSENKYTPVKETEKAITLYNENQVFFHTPRTKNYIKDVVIEVQNPPKEEKNEGPPAILTIGPSLIFGISSTLTSIVAIINLSKQKANLLSFITQMLMCGAMIISSLLLPFIIDKYNKHKRKKNEQKRQKVYTAYLDKKKQVIDSELKRQHDILYQNHLSVNELEKNISENTSTVWSREIVDDDFLTIRLGVGNKKASIIINSPGEAVDDEEKDNLRLKAKELATQPLVLNEVPITISLSDNKVLPLIVHSDFQYRQQFIDSIILQLFTYCSGMDLKIIILTDEKNKDKWNYIKFLPHCYSTDKKNHFFATNDDEMKQVSMYLEKEYIERLENLSSNKTDADRKVEDSKDGKVYKNYDKYYLVITDQFIKTNKLGIIDRILKSNINLGFSLLLIEPTMKNIPSQASSFVEVSSNSSFISDKNGERVQFKPEIINNNILSYAQIIDNIPIDIFKEASSLPTSINFLEMYQVGKIEQLNILNRWMKNDPVISLHTPVGVNEEGNLFELDLHEKFHGPHGLIAGATGSGKSEFIITYILSLAINYHPYEVQFVLIDYKGGGLAGAFENRETGLKIPHLAGTITNLDNSEMNRALVSIKSELKRRQRAFNEARDMLNESTVDIYKYQRFYRDGKVKNPISHLFIISDEFAELKSQQPEFMDELISTARIGRSLGVHLILATQKPSGVVNDQIWSNSRFKVCLKVQTAEDSMELLKRKEAASIKETGRFYLQVGYNESFELGQSAWAGAKYIPTDRIIRNVNDSIDFINNNGEIIKTINDSITYNQSEDFGDQLTNIVKTLYNLAQRENIISKQLWLPSIPPEIYLSNLFEKYQYKAEPYKINPLIGEFDVPANQFQDKLTINLTNGGNVLIFGIAGSGKENLLTTLIHSVCLYHSPDEVNFYILDFGAETLRVFSDMPQVGDVVFSDDTEKIKSEFLMLEKEMNRRKELFAEYGGNYTRYVEQCDNKIPLIITVLNGYEGFLENHGSFNDYFAHLLRESSKYGIIFIMTAIAANSVTTRIQQSFNTKIALQLSDKFDYVYLLKAPNGLVPSKYFGRGLVTVGGSVFEFQTAYVYLKNKINDTIKDTAKALAKMYQAKAPKIPIIPKVVSADTMLPYIENLSNVPIGINTFNAQVERYNFKIDKISTILGKSATISTGFLTNLIGVFTSIPDIRLKVIDFVGCLQPSSDFEYYNGNFTDTIKTIKKDEKDTKIKIVYLIAGISYIHDKVLDEGISELFDVFYNLGNYPNSFFIFIDNYPSYRKITKEGWYYNVDTDNSIWIGKDFDLQNIIHVNKINKNDINNIEKDTIFKVSYGNYEMIKGIDNSNDGGVIY